MFCQKGGGFFGKCGIDNSEGGNPAELATTSRGGGIRRLPEKKKIRSPCLTREREETSQKKEKRIRNLPPRDDARRKDV